MAQSNMQILEAILNRNLQTEQEEEINNLRKLNHWVSSEPDRIFLLDEDETPNLIGYISTEDLKKQHIKETLKDSKLLYNCFGIKIYQLV